MLDFYGISGFQTLMNQIILKTEYKYTVLGNSRLGTIIRPHEVEDYFFSILVDADIYIINSKLEVVNFKFDGLRFESTRYDDYECNIKQCISIYNTDDPNLRQLTYMKQLVNKDYYERFNLHLNEMKGVHFETFKMRCKNMDKKYSRIINPLVQSYFELKIYKTRCYYGILKFSMNYRENKKDEWSLMYSEEILEKGLPPDFNKLITIIINKLDESEIPIIQIKYIVRKKIIEFSFERSTIEFDQSFPELEKIDTKNIENIIKEIYTNDVWIQLYERDINRLTIYFLMKNKLYYSLSEDQKYQMYESINQKYKQFKINYETNSLELELLQAINRKSNLVGELSEYSIESVDLMTGIEFEEFCKEIFIKLGYKVTTTAVTGDQGVDLIAVNSYHKIGIQVKRYSKKVTNKAVQEVVAGLNYYRLNKALVITNHYFTDSAISLATKNDVILWDRDMLITKIKEINSK